MDRDALRIQGTGEFGRISPALDARDLRRREGDHVEDLVVPVVDVEVVEISPGGAHDQDPAALPI
jgi:hypothetical protein